ncbi:putative protein TPRXL [Seriola dumerili]|uniref:putative protein TPRXL n=1 Tax=Seriola dumerili TaxID=41447 RepID=UPI000BBF0588|nr:putative protein TPRXL [Seriola dumerili]
MPTKKSPPGTTAASTPPGNTASLSLPGEKLNRYRSRGDSQQEQKTISDPPSRRNKSGVCLTQLKGVQHRSPVSSSSTVTDPSSSSSLSSSSSSSSSSSVQTSTVQMTGSSVWDLVLDAIRV